VVGDVEYVRATLNAHADTVGATELMLWFDYRGHTCFGEELRWQDWPGDLFGVEPQVIGAF